MTPEEIQRLLQQVPKASLAELMRMDLQIRLGHFQDELNVELDAEDEVSRLDDPDPILNEEIHCLPPVNTCSLMIMMADKAYLGVPTHVVVSPQVLLELWPDESGPHPEFQRVKHLPVNAKVQGFIHRLPIILDRASTGAFFRFENEQFESQWVQIKVTR